MAGKEEFPIPEDVEANPIPDFDPEDVQEEDPNEQSDMEGAVDLYTDEQRETFTISTKETN